MSDVEPDIADLTRRMDGAVSSMRHEFAGLRTGRASASMLDAVQVDAYGAKMPIQQLATVNVPEPRLLTVNVWDAGLVPEVEKAIRNADLGINPVVDGQLLRLPIPDLNEERRKELAKVAGKFAEQARVAIRNVRRDGMEQLRKLKSGGMSEDDHKIWQDEIQGLTNAHIKQVDDALAAKESEILSL